MTRYLLAKQDPRRGEPISNMKLQKLLYFAQGTCLAARDHVLWSGARLKAWKFGPVVPDVWHTYKPNGSKPIPPVVDLDETRYPEWAVDVMERVLAKYGPLTARKLSDLTHREPPWLIAWDRKATGGSDLISDAQLRERFVSMSAQAGELDALSPKAVWSLMRAIPGWEDEAQRAHEEIAEGRGIGLKELRRIRGL